VFIVVAGTRAGFDYLNRPIIIPHRLFYDGALLI